MLWNAPRLILSYTIKFPTSDTKTQTDRISGLIYLTHPTNCNKLENKLNFFNASDKLAFLIESFWIAFSYRGSAFGRRFHFQIATLEIFSFEQPSRFFFRAKRYEIGSVHTERVVICIIGPVCFRIVISAAGQFVLARH